MRQPGEFHLTSAPFSSFQGKSLGIVPPGKEFLDGRFFSGDDPLLQAYRLLRDEVVAAGGRCDTIDRLGADVDAVLLYRYDYMLPWLFPVIAARPDIAVHYVNSEPPMIAPHHSPDLMAHLPVHSVLTWDDDAVRSDPRAIACKLPCSTDAEGPIPFVPLEERRDICCVAGNKKSSHPTELYSRREGDLLGLARLGFGADLFGNGWQNAQGPIRALWKGRIGEKSETMRRYTFALCYENCHGLRGYVTEKIVDCILSGTIPVYWGADNVSDYFPDFAYVDRRRFGSVEELHAHLAAMPAEEIHRRLDETRRFVARGGLAPFMPRRFVENVAEAMRRTPSPRHLARHRAAYLRIALRSFRFLPREPRRVLAYMRSLARAIS